MFCSHRELHKSISFDMTPAFLSTSDDLLDFLQQGGLREEGTHTRSRQQLSVSFDVSPAFLSTSEDLLGQPIEERVDGIGMACLHLSPSSASRSGHAHSQCTPPGGVNPMVFQRPFRQPGGIHFLVPELKQLHVPPHCNRGGDQLQFKCVYPIQEPTRYLLPDVKCDGFPYEEELVIPDRTMIYSSEVSCHPLYFNINTPFVLLPALAEVYCRHTSNVRCRL